MKKNKQPNLEMTTNTNIVTLFCTHNAKYQEITLLKNCP